MLSGKSCFDVLTVWVSDSAFKIQSRAINLMMLINDIWVGKACSGSTEGKSFGMSVFENVVKFRYWQYLFGHFIIKNSQHTNF